MARRFITNSSVLGFFSFVAVVAALSFDIRTFFVGYIPIALITSLLLFLYIFCFFGLSTLKNSDNIVPKIKFYPFDLVVFFFFVLYGIRLIYNIFIEQIPHLTFVGRHTYLVYFLFVCIIPFFLGRRVIWADLNIEKCLKILVLIFGIGLIISFKNSLSIIFSGNSAFHGRFEANEMLDTIGYGHSSLVFMIIIFALLQKFKIRRKWLYYVFLAFGLFSMALANSRSPFVALLFIVAFYIIIKGNYKLFLVSLMILFLLIYNINYIDGFFQNNFNSMVVNRVATIFEFSLNNSSGRGAIYKEGISLFMDNPIFGRSILLLGENSGLYPHNSIIEVFMSTGVIGGSVFILINIISFKQTYFLIKNDSKFMFLGLIFLQQFVYSMFSRCILLFPIYFFCIAAVFTVYKIEKSK